MIKIARNWFVPNCHYNKSKLSAFMKENTSVFISFHQSTKIISFPSVFNMGSILVLQFAVLALLLSFHSSFASMVSSPSNTEKEALLSFKSQITTDPSYSLSTWHKDSNHCNWTGVFCDRYMQRVISLDLSGLGLTGTISSHIGNLSSLTSINLQENQLGGTIPGQIGDLHHLKVFNLSYNRIVGSVVQYHRT